MKKFIVTFGFNGDEGYQVVKSKPITAATEDEASLILKDQFESLEGISCTIISAVETN
jgi:hypothetical protein